MSYRKTVSFSARLINDFMQKNSLPKKGKKVKSKTIRKKRNTKKKSK